MIFPLLPARCGSIDVHVSGPELWLKAIIAEGSCNKILTLIKIRRETVIILKLFFARSQSQKTAEMSQFCLNTPLATRGFLRVKMKLTFSVHFQYG
jgi:hypothetical protein